MKIISKMNQNNIHSNSLIIGCDSDFIPICISTKKNVDFLHRSFSTNSEMFEMEILDSILKEQFNSNDIHDIKSDLTFLCLLCGNDYLPKLQGFDLAKIWGNYTKFKMDSNENLIKIDENNLYSINFPFLLKCMSQPLIHSGMVIDRRSIIQYLKLLLWNFEMYSNGECMDYQFMPEIHSFISPQMLHAASLEENFSDLIQPPRNRFNSLDPLTVSRAVIFFYFVTNVKGDA
jgi:hypothetical protein